MIALHVRACASPADKKPLALPKRVVRVRRVRLKKAVKEDKEFVDIFFKKTQEMWDEIKASSYDDDE